MEGDDGRLGVYGGSEGRRGRSDIVVVQVVFRAVVAENEGSTCVVGHLREPAWRVTLMSLWWGHSYQNASWRSLGEELYDYMSQHPLI